ncbi:GPW/gp25 family protein [Hymenobacter ruricola]|uniref:GPW/gp25 family protein n=1 Tax=Hymenobacter ruricola TaxID=2791023 RepID=A0ABS0I7K6_9BACT|nr:GPW/gp25 family protein [Hymenobacter ruricola]MBF9222673.1 GPW/gp25 family protein [Hymenobacter ruricola]
MAHERSSTFLGQGWSFPPRFDTGTKSLALTRDEEDVQQSIYILLHTEPGERIMNPEYGCPLRQFLFETPTLTRLTELQQVVERAILHFEPRVIAGQVRASTDQINDGLLLLEVDYTIRTINSRHNVVYPFYYREATLLDT